MSCFFSMLPTVVVLGVLKAGFILFAVLELWGKSNFLANFLWWGESMWQLRSYIEAPCLRTSGWFGYHLDDLDAHDIPWPSMTFHDFPWLPRLRWCRIDHCGSERELRCFSRLSGRQHHCGRDNGHSSSTNLIFSVANSYLFMWYLLMSLICDNYYVIIYHIISLCCYIYIYYNMILSLVNVINTWSYTMNTPRSCLQIWRYLAPWETLRVDLRGSFIKPVFRLSF